MTTQPSVLAQPTQADDDWMLPDPPRKFDMLQHNQQVDAESMLKGHFKNRRDVVVSGEGYIRRSRADASDMVAPDIIVGVGLDPRLVYRRNALANRRNALANRRNGWVISEMGKPPDFVLEVASESTARRDVEQKPAIYARLGAPERWMFDETGGELYPAALEGYALVDGLYVPIPMEVMEDGALWGLSGVLGLYVCSVEGRLRFYDPVNREYLPDTPEAMDLLEDAEASLAAERRAREDAEASVAIERQARLAAEAELARVSKLLSDNGE